MTNQNEKIKIDDLLSFLKKIQNELKNPLNQKVFHTHVKPEQLDYETIQRTIDEYIKNNKVLHGAFNILQEEINENVLSIHKILLEGLNSQNIRQFVSNAIFLRDNAPFHFPEKQIDNATIQNIEDNSSDRLNNIENSIYAWHTKATEIQDHIITLQDNLATYANTIKNLENKISPIDSKLTEAEKILDVSKKALEFAQKTKTIEYTDTLYQEYKTLETKYYMAGLLWLGISLIVLYGFYYTLFCYSIEFKQLNDDMIKLFENGFVSSIYALSPILIKVSALIILMTLMGISLKLFSDYKRLAQEYRHKTLLAKNLLSGVEILNTYIDKQHVVNGFVLPSIEKLLEDPMTKIYNDNQATEQTLGLVQKIMDIGKAGKETVS